MADFAVFLTDNNDDDELNLCFLFGIEHMGVVSFVMKEFHL